MDSVVTPFLKRQRNSSIEVLRLIAILFVVASHWGVNVYNNMPNGIEYSGTLFSLSHSIDSLGKIGVDIFFIISGFGMAFSTKMKWQKIILISLEVLFYSSIVFGLNIFLLSIGFLNNSEFSFSFNDPVNVFKTTWYYIFNFAGSGLFWFVTTYLVVLLLAPFINISVKHLNTRGHFLLCLFLFITTTILPNIGISGNATFPLLGIECYVLGTFIRYHHDWFARKKWVWLAIGIVGVVLKMFLSGYLYFLKASTGNPWISIAISWFVSTYSILTLVPAFALVCFFASFSFKNYFINLFASTTYGIYLMHVGVTNISIYKALHTLDFLSEPYNGGSALLSFIIWCGVILFAGCLIDLVRQLIFELPLKNLLTKINFGWTTIERD